MMIMLPSPTWFKFLKNFLIHIDWQVQATTIINFALVVERTSIDYFLNIHDIACELNKKI